MFVEVAQPGANAPERTLARGRCARSQFSLGGTCRTRTCWCASGPLSPCLDVDVFDPARAFTHLHHRAYVHTCWSERLRNACGRMRRRPYSSTSHTTRSKSDLAATTRGRTVGEVYEVDRFAASIDGGLTFSRQSRRFTPWARA